MSTVELKPQTQTQPQALLPRGAPLPAHERGLSQSTLKLIAAVLMIIDHVGLMLFPTVRILRIIGRLSFPLFAYFVYEGSRYTHSKARYLLRMLTLGVVCVIGYYIYSGAVYGNVLITFSFSIVTLYAVQRLKGSVRERCGAATAVNAVLLAVCVVVAYVVCIAVEVDYGFCGIMLPVLAEVFTPLSCKEGVPLPRGLPTSFIGFAAGLVCLCLQMGGIQWWSLCSVVLLVMYSGRRGKSGRGAQWFFYLFYPAHLAVIGSVSALL